MLALLAEGCAAQRAVFGGRIELVEEQKDPVPGLVLRGKAGRPILCYGKPGESFADLKQGQWAVLEGARNDQDMAIHVSGCEILAISTSDPTDSCEVELRRRAPQHWVPGSPAAKGSTP